MDKDPRFQVENDQIKKLLRDIGLTLGSQMPPGWGFTLLIFEYVKASGEASSMFYISSARRADMRKAMQEFLKDASGEVK